MILEAGFDNVGFAAAVNRAFPHCAVHRQAHANQRAAARSVLGGYGATMFLDQEVTKVNVRFRRIGLGDVA